MLKARNFRAGHWLYSANCYEQSELCRADSVGSKPLVANSCDCLREQARAQKGYRPSAICSARYLPRPSAPPSPIAPSKILACPIEKYGHPQKVNVQVPRLLFRPSFLSHPLGGSADGGAYALRPWSWCGWVYGGLVGVFRLRRPPQNAGMKHHSVSGNDRSGARSDSDDGCFWSPSPTAEQIGQLASRNSSRMSWAISSRGRFMVNISRTRACLSSA